VEVALVAEEVASVVAAEVEEDLVEEEVASAAETEAGQKCIRLLAPNAEMNVKFLLDLLAINLFTAVNVSRTRVAEIAIVEVEIEIEEIEAVLAEAGIEIGVAEVILGRKRCTKPIALNAVIHVKCLSSLPATNRFIAINALAKMMISNRREPMRVNR
jgi:hypothetical protein